MAARAMDLETYLGHTTRAGGSGQFMRSWKERDADGDRPKRAMRCFLHTRAPLMAVWQHGIPKVVTRTKDNITTNEVWGGKWNCIEPDEDTLKKQYFRDKETKEREHPPTVCPICILLEVVRRMVENKEIKFTQALFRWEGDDESKADVITAAGLYNGYKGDLTRSQKMAMKKARISPKESWKESMYAKCNYVLTVVDADNVGDGIQITTETSLLGDCIKIAIRDRMTAEGADAGNPMKNPVCFQWEYRKDEKLPQDKYHALVLPRIKLSKEVRELIVTKDPPTKTLETITKPGNIAELRAELEAHCLIDNMPWDEIFGPAEAEYGDDSPEPEEPEEDDDAPESGPVSDVGEAAPESGPADPPQAKASQAGEDVVACDVCKGEMLESASTCPHCESRYDPDDDFKLVFDSSKVEKKPPMRTRSGKRAAAAKPKYEAPDVSDAFGPDDDDIPF